MNLGSTYISKKKLILGSFLIIFLIVSTAVVLYMYMTKTFIFKSRAATNVIDAFYIKDKDGKDLVCDGAKNECTTDSLDISISVKSLEELTRE